jgi:hypothetical protein
MELAGFVGIAAKLLKTGVRNIGNSQNAKGLLG